MPLDLRTEFHRVVIKSSPTSKPNAATADGSPQISLKAYSTGGQRSSRVASLAQANGLVILPALKALETLAGELGETRKRNIEAGEHVQAVVIGEIEMS